MQLHMAVFCSTHLVSSTVVCSSEGAAWILWAVDWLQQTGEGEVHNVAHKITKVLK
jgi:hypothetical protein